MPSKKSLRKKIRQDRFDRCRQRINQIWTSHVHIVLSYLSLLDILTVRECSKQIYNLCENRIVDLLNDSNCRDAGKEEEPSDKVCQWIKRTISRVPDLHSLVIDASSKGYLKVLKALGNHACNVTAFCKACTSKQLKTATYLSSMFVNKGENAPWIVTDFVTARKQMESMSKIERICWQLNQNEVNAYIGKQFWHNWNSEHLPRIDMHKMNEDQYAEFREVIYCIYRPEFLSLECFQNTKPILSPFRCSILEHEIVFNHLNAKPDWQSFDAEFLTNQLWLLARFRLLNIWLLRLMCIHPMCLYLLLSLHMLTRHRKIGYMMLLLLVVFIHWYKCYLFSILLMMNILWQSLVILIAPEPWKFILLCCLNSSLLLLYFKGMQLSLPFN